MSEQHPDLVVLGDLADGALEGPERTDVERHLAGCADCQAATARLASIRDQLHQLPLVSMPTDIESRVRRALADEPMPANSARSTGSGPTSRRGREPQPVPAGRSRWRPGPGLVAASVIVVLVLVLVVGGGAVLAGRGGPETSSGSSASSAGGADSQAGPDSATGQSGQSRPGSTRTTSSGRNYTPSTLPDQVSRLLSASQQSATSSSSPSADSPSGTTGGNAAGAGSAGRSSTSGALSALHRPAVLARCLRAVTDNDARTPIAVDYARWRGQPAAVLVLPGSTSTTLAVYVVRTGCGSSARSTFLHFAQVHR